MVTVDYFSDVLCIWAYGGQIRLDELERRFGDQVELRYRFIPIFASAKTQIQKNWEAEGGYEAFNRHLQTVAQAWTHVSCHNKLWLECQPASSTTAHAVLKAVLLLEEQGLIDREPHERFEDRTCFEALMWNIRRAFFESAQNISEFKTLEKLVSEVGIDWQAVFQLIENGEAYAGLHRDDQLKEEYCVKGSPSFVLNEGRQVLYGNLGYRIIEANVDELLKREGGMEDASWC